MPFMTKYKDTLYDEKWLINEYINKQRTAIQMAEAIGCYTSAIVDALKKHNIPIRGRQSKFELLKDKEWLKKKYIDEKLNLNDIAELTGSTRGNVGCHLDTMGITLRDSSEARLMSDKVTYREGSDNNWWKGGIIMSANSNGVKNVKRVRCREHPMVMQNGYITWERYTLEHYYEAYLEDIGCQYKNCNVDFVLEIHHIDGNRENDSINNLVILCPNHHKAIERKVLKEDYDIRKMVTQKQT